MRNTICSNYLIDWKADTGFDQNFWLDRTILWQPDEAYTLLLPWRDWWFDGINTPVTLWIIIISKIFSPCCISLFVGIIYSISGLKMVRCIVCFLAVKKRQEQLRCIRCDSIDHRTCNSGKFMKYINDIR